MDKISLTVIDLSGFDSSIWESCAKLRKAKIPFLIITPQRSLSIQRESMRQGASGVIIKPFGIKDLSGYIHAVLGE